MKVEISTKISENDNYGILEITLEGVIDNTIYHQLIVAMENNLKILAEEKQEKYFNSIVNMEKAIAIEKIVRNKLSNLLTAKDMYLKGNKIAVVSVSPLIRSYLHIIIRRADYKNVRLFYDFNEAENWILKKST